MNPSIIRGSTAPWQEDLRTSPLSENDFSSGDGHHAFSAHDHDASDHLLHRINFLEHVLLSLVGHSCVIVIRFGEEAREGGWSWSG